MFISSINIKGLHGYIDKKLDFFNDTTLLVGINGAGKTSILNLINWLIQPSISHLCVTKFKSVTLKLTFKDIEYTITCKHLKSTFTYSVINSKGEKFPPLVVRRKYSFESITNNQDLFDKAFDSYTGLRPDDNEVKTWELIKNFPRPTIIGLDRHLYAEEADTIYFDENIRPNINSKRINKTLTPIDRAKNLINEEYRISKNSILNLTNDLKNHLMLSTFSDNINLDSFGTGIKQKLDIGQIDKAQKRVNEYFAEYANIELKSEDLRIVKDYFNNLREITLKYINTPTDPRVELLYGLNANQYTKIKKLLTAFEKFEKQSKSAKKKIDDFLTTINFFFKDSSKKLIFKEETSIIAYKSLDKNQNFIGDFRDIRNLSSGEQQILILFSYIAFNSGDGKVFIIDEPELSLHIKWQEDFLSYLDQIKPTGVQVILATHSPILANRKRDKTIVLLPYNE
ncbi:AAA family ATPase [Sphingobacterium lactis]|uniref:Predicted ATP-binding protein involved in virulence n=1 Tax=Sphingobacterium lactis TaxID=797291 RepID=A0A1H5ZYL4_9SPHI|nr:AAA family ATPase [Sphingobacterium lactis]SEG41064.1 Predicted ATP-binding protein involved in virulence [Sphingobacterium lactis]